MDPAESSEEDEHEISIIETLYDSLEDSEFSRSSGEFLPADVIDRIFEHGPFRGDVSVDPRQRVLRLLHATSNAAQYEPLVDFILTRARRLFLTCLMCDGHGHRARMSAFMDAGFDDDQLPVKYLSRASSKVEHPSSVRFSAIVDEENRQCGRRLWRRHSIDFFLVNQWRFLAPIISTSTLLHDFGERTMPFISEGLSSRDGAFSTVIQYEVHPAHFDSTEEVISIKPPNSMPR